MKTTGFSKKVRAWAGFGLAVFLLLPLGVAGRYQGKGKPSPPQPPPDPAIAFIQGGGGRGDLMVMNADGTNFRTLVSQSGAINEHPNWSPDGRHIVFESDIQGQGVYIAEVSTGNYCKLVATQTSFSRPSWSPVPLGDGKHKIAYADLVPLGDGTFTKDILFVDANVDCTPSTPQNLTKTPSTVIREGASSWSPDGTSLVAWSQLWSGGDCDYGLVVWDGIAVDAAGTPSYSLSWQLTGPGSSAPTLCMGTDANPDWANTSSNRVVFAGYNDPSTGIRDIWVADISNRGNPTITNLTNSSSTAEIDPSWSPDDSQIAFNTVRLSGSSFGYVKIYKMNADGSGTQVLATDKKLNYLHPAWRRNP